jgi:hypothetical protein
VSIGSDLPPVLRVEASGDRQGVHGQHHSYEHGQCVGIQVASHLGRTTPPLSIKRRVRVAVENALPPVSAQHLCIPPFEALEGHRLPAEDQKDSGELV